MSGWLRRKTEKISRQTQRKERKERGEKEKVRDRKEGGRREEESLLLILLAFLQLAYLQVLPLPQRQDPSETPDGVESLEFLESPRFGSPPSLLHLAAILSLLRLLVQLLDSTQAS